MRIFLSHSHQDNQWCNAFVAELKRYGADIWYDKRNLDVGDEWIPTIETELEGRETFLIILTPDSWASKWVRKEINLALARHKHIISVKHKPTEVSGFIIGYQMLDAIGLSSMEAAKSVATALGLAREEQPAGPTHPHAPKLSDSLSAGSTVEQYEYFEITTHEGALSTYYKIANTENGQVLYRQSFRESAYFGSSNNPGKHQQRDIEKLRKYAKTNGLEELSEKGTYWYSYRFRRKKQ